MDLIPCNTCKKLLDFQPNKSWPKNWPAFSWEKILISGFTHTDKPVLNFKSEDVKFLHLFHSCYPDLHLSEMGRIISQWNNITFTDFSWKEFFSFYGLQNTDLLIQQLKILVSTPSSFQDWVDKKEIHPTALRVLSSLKNIKQANFLFQWITKHNLSQSLGIKVLELGVELLLMDIPFNEILKSNLSPEDTIQAIEKKRKPLSTTKDEIKKRKLKNILWPSHVTGQWNRKGDKTGIEIKIWSQNQKELEEKINRIHQMNIFNHLNKKVGNNEHKSKID